MRDSSVPVSRDREHDGGLAARADGPGPASSKRMIFYLSILPTIGIPDFWPQAASGCTKIDGSPNVDFLVPSPTTHGIMVRWSFPIQPSQVGQPYLKWPKSCIEQGACWAISGPSSGNIQNLNVVQVRAVPKDYLVHVVPGPIRFICSRVLGLEWIRTSRRGTL